MRNAKVLVVDVTEDLARQVERVTSALRPRPEVVSCAGLDEAEDVIHEHGPFAVLVAGTIVTKDRGLQDLRGIRDRAPHMQLILAFDQWRASMMREVVRAGASDVLRLPVDDDVLLEAVEQALNNRPVAPHTVEELPRPSGRGTVTTVVSATGGCGKTFLATNIGYHLLTRADGRTCLLDLDLQFGELATALRLRPKSTIVDLLAQDPESDDLASRFEEHLEHHETGLRVLAAPEEPAQADAIDAEDVSRVIESARSRFDHVVIDTPAALTEGMLVALDHADQIFVLATLDLPSIRNLGLLLSTFEQLKVPAERAKLVLNKVEPDVGIDVGRVTKYFPQGFSMVIPYGREVNRSLNLGQPVLAYAPHGDVSKALAAGLSANVEGVGADSEPPRRRWLGRRQKRPA